VTDLFDRAQEREEEMRSDALAELARRADGSARLPFRAFCSVCEEAIPPQRIAALPGVQTCVECQTDLENGLLQ
jgi:phage/conjugal plasmid C-4 type zinc finger TraR family protein